MFAEQPSPIQSPEDAASDRSPMLDGNAHIFKLENDTQGNITNIEDAYANPNTAGDVTEQIQPITEPEVAISYDAESFDPAAQAFPEAPVQPTADERVAALLKIYTEAGPRNEQKVEALVRAMVAEITAASATAENALQQVDALQNTVSRHEILIDNQREEIFGLQLKVTKLTDFIRGNGEKAKTTPSALEDTKPTTRVEVPAELNTDDGDARLNLDMDFLNDIPDTTNWVKVKPEVPSTPRKPDNDLPIDLPEVDGDDLPDLDGDLDDLDTDFWNSTPNAEASTEAKPSTVDLLRTWGNQPDTRRPKQKAEANAPSKPKAEAKEEGVAENKQPTKEKQSDEDKQPTVDVAEKKTDKEAKPEDAETAEKNRLKNYPRPPKVAEPMPTPYDPNMGTVRIARGTTPRFQETQNGFPKDKSDDDADFFNSVNIPDFDRDPNGSRKTDRAFINDLNKKVGIVSEADFEPKNAEAAEKPKGRFTFPRLRSLLRGEK